MDARNYGKRSGVLKLQQIRTCTGYEGALTCFSSSQVVEVAQKIGRVQPRLVMHVMSMRNRLRVTGHVRNLGVCNRTYVYTHARLRPQSPAPRCRCDAALIWRSHSAPRFPALSAATVQYAGHSFRERRRPRCVSTTSWWSAVGLWEVPVPTSWLQESPTGPCA